MKVTVAKSAGFCFGVKRAVNMVYEAIEKSEKAIYTYGPIIHNDEVIKDMEAGGVKVVNSLEELDSLPKGIMIIRSHGISRAEHEYIENSGFEIMDATCPFVLKIHKIVREASEAGSQVVIIGNENHPEVQGIMGWCVNTPYVVDSISKAESLVLNPDKNVCIVSQTTFNYNKFKELVEIIEKKGYNSTISNTICNATEERQTEARKIAREADAMIVIGGKSSSNTRKLYEICKSECENTYYIQTISDLDLSVLAMAECIGITAGASTPKNIIEEVYTNVREEL